jgi:hypothetical protein
VRAIPEGILGSGTFPGRRGGLTGDDVHALSGFARPLSGEIAIRSCLSCQERPPLTE